MDFFAETKTIAPATSIAAPASEYVLELERSFDDHMSNARPINDIEIIISRIRIRIELFCISVGMSRSKAIVGWPT